MLFKKADVGLGAIIVIIIIIIFLGWLINEGWKECRVDSNCKDGQYCNSKFECKDIPVIQKMGPQQNFLSNYGAWVIGISLIAAALILKWDSIFGKKKGKDKQKRMNEYVDLSKSHNISDKGMFEDFIEDKF